MSRQEKQARTRAELLAAAGRVVAQRGFRDATLAEVAREAGVSTGAVYSNFSGKEDLFLAVFEDRVEQRLVDIELAAGADRPAGEQASRAGTQFADVLRQDTEWFLLFFEFWLQAARDPAFGARFAERHAAAQTQLGKLVAARGHQHGLALPLAPDQLAIALTALGYGLALERLIHPANVTTDLVAHSIAQLLGLNG